MNVPNKITICRIILSILLIVLMIFPMNRIGFDFPEFQINGKIIIDSKYIICGIIFVVASLTDFLDGHLARKYNLVTDIGKVMDAIADKILEGLNEKQKELGMLIAYRKAIEIVKAGGKDAEN